MDESLFKQLVEVFKGELESLLLVINANLQELQKGDKADYQKEIEEIARSGRNIKVSAGAIEAREVSRIAHLIEKLYSSGVVVSPEIIALSSRSVTAMREAMGAFSEHRTSDFDDLIRQLELHLPVQEKPVKKIEPPPPPQPKADFQAQIVEVFRAELEEKLLLITNGLIELETSRGSGKDVTKIFDEIFRAAHNIKGSGRGVGALDVGEIAHRVETLFSAIQKKSIEISPAIITLCLKAVDAMRLAMQCYTEKQPLPFDLPAFLKELEQCREEKPVKFEPMKQVPSKPSEYESIRVSLHTLDRVSALMEEMQVNKIAVEDHYTDLAKVHYKTNQFIHSWKADQSSIKGLTEIGSSIDAMHKEMRARVNELRITFDALQDEVRMLRLVPVTNELGNMPRIVRDLSVDLHKQVDLEIHDNGVKIDKIVLDGLKDPIVHILRNSIDHGMEAPEVRKSLGKPERGLIRIDVSEEGGHILFKISDDGSGINLDKVLQTALQKNILTKTEAETMSKEDIIELIFRPGFSTKESATDISGRGVGLDAVRTNLTALKGQVSLTTEPGKGTTFYLRVPLTLATERGLIVECSGQLFVLLTSSVKHVLLLGPRDIVEVEGSRAVLVDNQPVLLSSLSEILELEGSPQRTILPTVIVKKNGNSLGLLVDEIVGEREIVLKPLQAPLTNINCVIGATLSGSNQIIFVLNSADIIKKAGRI